MLRIYFLAVAPYVPYVLSNIKKALLNSVWLQMAFQPIIMLICCSKLNFANVLGLDYTGICDIAGHMGQREYFMVFRE